MGVISSLIEHHKVTRYRFTATIGVLCKRKGAFTSSIDSIEVPMSSEFQ